MEQQEQTSQVPEMFTRLPETLVRRQEREARDTALAKHVAEAVAREMAKAHAHYQALLNERSTAVIPTSLEVTSRASGFKVMDPFGWTKDKAIYQRW